jgi:VWFA-related protein
MAQTATPDANTPPPTVRINSRAVLVDVVVTDKNGKPVTGLKQDAFSVTEQGKPQTMSFFEEHTGAPAAAPKELPKFPPDVFSNFSPYPLPPAVNVLLLDSLNTRMENQMFVHQQALKFLKDLKPGSRMAIFTMDLGLHFLQGFTDDPALLFAALGNKKNNEVQNSVMVAGQEETNAQQNLVGMMSASAGGHGGTTASPAMTAALQTFMNEISSSQQTGNVLLTMANLQRLATFLDGFPGRKNVIWFSESPMVVERLDPQTEDEWEKTRNMLAAARVALYPVDARGVSTIGFYQAGSQLNGSINSASQIIGPTGIQSQRVMAEDAQRNAEQSQMRRIAEETGGRAFVNTNGLSDVLATITADSANFYTLSYTPTNAKMDGAYRNIEVSVAGAKLNLSYRRGYYARDTGLPGSAMATRQKEINKLAAQNPGAVDPLLPFMDLGMPQSEQILYMVKIQPMAPKADAAAPEQTGAKIPGQAYSVDFAIDLKDLDLKLDSDGLHKGTLNITMIAYDRYGKIASRQDHVVQLNLKPDVYAYFQKTGVPPHFPIELPKGQYWLRIGVYDQGSRKVGTMEVALSSVVPLQASAK